MIMRTLLTSTAVAALLTTGALAQEAVAPGTTTTTTTMDTQTLLTQGYQGQGMEDLASQLIGQAVFNSATEDADRIGEINDLIVAEDGTVSAVLIGVGGFLGIGEKAVAVSYSDLEWTPDQNNEMRLVINVSQEALANAPAFEFTEDQFRSAGVMRQDTMATDQMGADPAMTEDQVAEQPMEQTVDENLETGTITTNDPATQAPGDERTTFDPANATLLEMGALTADELTGTDVYGPNNEHIGPIGDLVLGEDGQTIDALIIDFGGFLGLGTKQVAVAFENLQFYTDDWGNRSLVLPITREQMEAAPEFNAENYANQRDQQRLIVDGTAAGTASAS